MKKLKRLLPLLTIALLISCSNDQGILENQLTNYESEQVAPKTEIIVGGYFTWDEWGRKRFDCERNGLCNFRLEAITITIKSAVVQGDENGNLWVDIPIDDTMPDDDGFEYFPIDEDLFFTTENEDTYSVEAGLYPLNTEIGEVGGYRLPIIKI